MLIRTCVIKVGFARNYTLRVKRARLREVPPHKFNATLLTIAPYTDRLAA